MTDSLHNIKIKVFSGDQLFAEPQELRPIRLLPNGTWGVTYRKNVYPLYLWDDVNIRERNFDNLCRLDSNLEHGEACINLNDENFIRDICPILNTSTTNLSFHHSRGQYMLRQINRFENYGLQIVQ